MDIREKEKILEASCKRLLANDVEKLNKLIDLSLEQQIKDELQEYQEKEEFAYNKKMEKLEKDYNKQLYSMEMETKKEILNQKKLIQKDLKKEVVEILKNFTRKTRIRRIFEEKN